MSQPLTPASASLFFSLLGNERRLRVLMALVSLDTPASPSTLSPVLDIPKAQLSDLLQDLASLGLVRSGRSGRYVLYEANRDMLSSLACFLTQIEEPEDADK